jgi:hypothetical protein
MIMGVMDDPWDDFQKQTLLLSQTASLQGGCPLIVHALRTYNVMIFTPENKVFCT